MAEWKFHSGTGIDKPTPKRERIRHSAKPEEQRARCRGQPLTDYGQTETGPEQEKRKTAGSKHRNRATGRRCRWFSEIFFVIDFTYC